VGKPWENVEKTKGKWIKMDGLSDLTLIEVEKLGFFWVEHVGSNHQRSGASPEKRIYIAAFWLHRFC
jgi:hypothetical protein